MQDTPLHIKQTLDTDPEINFINWELNVQDVASTTGRTISGDQGLLDLVLNPAQWNAHALSISINDEGLQVIAPRYAAPAHVELDADMMATQITIAKARNKTREDWMIAEQNLKRAMMAYDQAHHCPPTIIFSEHDAHRHHQRDASALWENNDPHGRTARRLDEILAEKMDNLRNFKTHTAKMQNAFSIGTTAGILPIDELARVKLLRTSILGHHVMEKLIEGYDHDYPEFLQQTFANLCEYLKTHLSNAESRDTDTKAHGLSVQQKGRFEDDILLPMNADQITAYLAATGEAKRWKKNKRSQQSSTASSSDDDSEQPEKRQRVELYCFWHGTQYSHTSMECKVMAADKNCFTHAMRNATNAKSLPGGSFRKHGAQLGN
jgi:hypothetical protein